MKPLKRPNWDEYFMQIAQDTKARSNCLTRQVGAVIVRDKRIIATGYNGTPMGIKNCFEGGCERCMRRHKGEIKSGQEEDRCICVHAEQNAIVQSAYHGISTKGSILFTTASPCRNCTKMIINAGIVEIVALEKYPDDLSLELFQEAGIPMRMLEVKTAA